MGMDVALMPRSTFWLLPFSWSTLTLTSSHSHEFCSLTVSDTAELVLRRAQLMHAYWTRGLGPRLRCIAGVVIKFINYYKVPSFNLCECDRGRKA
jgi:hypothetical protein